MLSAKALVHDDAVHAARIVRLGGLQKLVPEGRLLWIGKELIQQRHGLVGQVRMGQQCGHLSIQTRLAGTEEFTGPPETHILFGQGKAVLAGAEQIQARPSGPIGLVAD